MKAATLESVMSNIFKTPDGCWLWMLGLDADGYGKTKYRGRSWKTHRLVWTLLVGQIPDGMFMDHLCLVRSCVNPSHLEVVTPMGNTLTGNGPARVNREKTHCIHGHELAGKNLYAYRGGRFCKRCAVDRMRKHRGRRTA